MEKHLGPLVSVNWLADHLEEVVVADTRWYLDGRSGREAYENGHIAGAVHVDLDTHLSADPPRAGGRHPLPSPMAFAKSMSNLGISDESTVVAYDDCAGMVASRLWWMLDSLEHRCAVLDGGIQAWSQTLSIDLPAIDREPFTPKPWPTQRFATADAVANRSSGTVLIDARSTERFAGGENNIDPRFGHIPGATSAPWTENIKDQAFKTPEQLTDRFTGIGIKAATPVIAYCGSGVSACSNLLALRLAGHEPSQLYVGSWSEWGADDSRPIETL